MLWTKQDIALKAIEEIGYAAYIYDVMPEQIQSVLVTLDNMMAAWYDKGIRLGYASSNSPVIDGTQPVAVNASTRETIIANLAVKIAPRFGKQISQETKAIAVAGYSDLLSRAATIPQMKLPATMPVGAGNKRYTNSPFVMPVADELTLNDNEQLEL